MSNYTKTTDFAAKDGLTSGSAGKIIRGAEFETEFDNIATAITTKADLASPSFSGTINVTSASFTDGSVTITGFLDEDDLSTNSASHLPTQQSVKAYVDTAVAGIVTDGGTQTLTNKTLTSPVIDTSVSGTAVLDDDTFATASNTTLATSESIKAYVDSNTGSASLTGLTDNATKSIMELSAGNNVLFNGGGDIIFYDTNGLATTTFYDTSAEKWINFASRGIDDQAAGTSVYINANNDVGVGQSSPTARLHIKDSGGGGIPVIIEDTAESENYIKFVNQTHSSGGCLIGSLRNEFVVAVESQEKLRITNSEVLLDNAGTVRMSKTLLGQYLGTGTYDTSPINVTTASTSGTTYNVVKFGGSGTNTEIGEIKWKSYGATAGATLLCQGGNTVIELRGQSGGTNIEAIINGGLNLPDLPTSSAGLSSGDVWNDSGTLKIVT